MLDQRSETRSPGQGFGENGHGAAPNQEPRIDSDIPLPVTCHMSSEP
jgi:hypothetical protein